MDFIMGQMSLAESCQNTVKQDEKQPSRYKLFPVMPTIHHTEGKKHPKLLEENQMVNFKDEWQVEKCASSSSEDRLTTNSVPKRTLGSNPGTGLPEVCGDERASVASLMICGTGIH